MDRLTSRWGRPWRSFSGTPGDLAWYGAMRGPGSTVLAVKPRTFMNRSGRAAEAACDEACCEADGMIVVYDDADLELGRLRIRGDGGAGGHNGIRSLIDRLERSDFARVRVGVRGDDRGEQELADYVLSPFEVREERVVEAAIDRAADAVESLMRRGLTATMNEFNGGVVASEGQDLEV